MNEQTGLANPLVLFHGSDHVVKRPRRGLGRERNDFGRGFYCTEDVELAKEWAATHDRDGIANKYELDTAGLSVLRLDAPRWSVLHWISVLVRHRSFRIRNPVASRGLRYLSERFPVVVDRFDIVVGWRADDSHFDYAEAFLNNAITVQQLSAAMELGNLGLQVVLKSERAFDPERLRFAGWEPADRTVYAIRRETRNDAARAGYERLLLELDEKGLYLSDVMREEIRDGDARLR